MHPVKRLLLIRHCESMGQAADAPLSERGHEQARALARDLALQPIDRVISSPFLRAQQTIEPFVQQVGLALEFDARLVEKTLSREPIPSWREEVQRSFVDFEHTLPGGESSREAQARGRAALDAALAAGHTLPALVSHGQLMSLILHSIDPAFGFDEWARLANPDVFVVEGATGGSPLRFRRLALPSRRMV